MIRPQQQEQEQMCACIRLGIDEGARLVTGGPQIPDGLEKGNYVTPTVFADVDSESGPFGGLNQLGASGGPGGASPS